MNCNYHYCSKSIFTLLLSIFFLCSAFPVEIQAQYDFRLRLEKGQTFTLSTLTEQSSSQVIAGKKESINQKIISRDFIEIKDKIDKNYWVDVTRKFASYETSGSFESFSYTSENKTAHVPDPAVGYAMLVGCTFHLKMNDKGEVLELIDLTESFSTVSQNLKKMRPEMGSSLIQQVKASFTPQTLQEGFAPLGHFFPPKKVEVGESWNKELAIFEGFPVKVNTEYLLQRIEDYTAHIELSSSFQQNENAQTGDMAMFDDFNGKQEGSAEIRLKDGLVHHSIVKQIASAYVKNPDPGSEKSLIEFTSVIKSKIEE